MKWPSWIGILLIAACSRDAERVDPFDYLTAHVWESTGYVINGRQYNSLVQYRAYVSNDVISDLNISPGDTMSYGFRYELLFTDDYVLKEIRHLDVSYKCNSCSAFRLLDSYSFSSEEVYTLNNTFLFVTAENVVLLDSTSSNTHRYRLISNQKMELYDWRVVSSTNPGIYNISINGISVPSWEALPIDFIFEASL